MRRLWTLASRRRLLLVVAATSVITLAASSPIYSARSGWHVTGHSTASPVAIAGGTAAAPDCSIAAASEAATAANFDVDPALGRTPINHVICGPFLGPGSQAMAAMVAVPTGCGVSTGWAVFRFAGAAWQIVMKQDNGALRLQAVGSDIRETQGYPGSGDAYCHPSRMRTRIWHWNGNRFTHTVWTYSKPRPTKLFYFESPSHNIWCDSGDEGQAYCATKTPSRSVTLKLDGTITICASRRCSGPGKFGGDPVLAYGRVNEQGGFRCKSGTTAMTCTVMLRGQGFAFGKGFRISRSGVTRIGS